MPGVCATTLILAGCGPILHDCVRYSEDHRECRLVTSAGLSFENTQGITTATVHPVGNLPVTAVEWPERALPHRAIDTSKSYRAEFLRASIRRGRSDRDWIDHTLVRISDGDHVLYDASICPLHHEAMERRIEKGVSGLDYPDSFFKGSIPRICPNDGKAYLLCSSGIRHLTWRCPTCHRISEDWRKRKGLE